MQENEDENVTGSSDITEEYSLYLMGMNKILERQIETAIESKYFDAAPELLSMTLGQIPESRIIKLVIHDLLMKTPNEYTAVMVFKYLNNFLDIFILYNNPQKPKLVDFFYEALAGERNLWDVVENIIRSCTAPDVNEEPTGFHGEEVVSKIYNGKLLLSYYIKVLNIEFNATVEAIQMQMEEQQMAEEATLGETMATKVISKSKFMKHQCLIAKLFWPDGEISMKSSNCIDFLIWINKLYSMPESLEKEEILLHLHELLNLMMKFIIFYEGFSEIVAINSQHFDKMAIVVCNYCSDIFKVPEKSTKFLSLIELYSLRILICKNLIHKLIHSSYQQVPLTFRKIVRQYMFPKHSNKNRLKRGKNICRSSPKKNDLIERNYKGETALHAACREDNTGTLLELLRMSSDVNVKDNNGCTPLHVACLAQSDMSVYSLCTKEYHKGKIDYLANNNDGQIPLHFAVQSNSVGIAEKLLECGGSGMLHVKDNKGKTPARYASNLEMKQLLRKFAKSQIVTIVEAENIHNVDKITTRKPPLFSNKKSYSIYLLCLEYLINDFIKIFHLNSSRRRNQILKDLVAIREHFEEESSIPPNYYDVVARCDDLVFMQNGSVMLEDFVKDLNEQASDAELDISRQLMKFKFTCYLRYLSKKTCNILNQVC